MHDPNYRKITAVDQQQMIDLNYNHHVRMTEDYNMHVNSGKRQQIEENDYDSYKQILSHVPDGGYCLELGSGAGRQFDVLSTKFNKISGIDIHEPSVKAGQLNGLDIRLSTLENMPFDDEIFDVVTSRHVMEHTYDVQKALKEIKRVLKPGGYVCAVTPAYQPDPEIAHITQLGINEWQKEYKNAGFEIISAELLYFNCLECHIVARKIKEV